MTKPYKTILTIDYETRWSSKPTAWSPGEAYTLSKMTTEAYIRDPRFKAFGCCIHELGATTPVQWYRHEELPRIFGMYDWKTTAVLMHNSVFDAGILSFVYGVNPCFIFDSLSMARALRGVEAGNSLMRLAEEFGLPPKGRAVHSTDGLEELTPEIERELAEYCKHDVFLCEKVFERLLYDPYPYPAKELRLIDMTIRMFTQPQLQLDTGMLHNAVTEEKRKLAQALERCGVAEEDLASNDRFCNVLRGMGVEVPMKVSKTTGAPAPALAKNDALFQALLNGDNEDVALLCEARLKVKSTLERTRAQRFIDIASRGALPVPLKYYGAETGRWSADGSVNLQNMKRGSFLRKAIHAPEGYALVVGDLSQIEPRVLGWLSEYDELLDTFRSGADVYAAFGATMFNVPGMTKETHPLLRQSAKSALLGAGYGLGWASFAAQLLVGFLGAPPLRYTKEDAKQLGVTRSMVDRFVGNTEQMKKMLEIPHTCTDAELLTHCMAAKAIIEKYRATATPVTDMWRLLDELTARCLIGGEEVTHRSLTFRKGEIVMANGMRLKYPNIELRKDKHTGKSQYVYGLGDKKRMLYSGRICNNATQGTARIVMSDAMLRVAKRYPVKGTVHDEMIVLVPKGEVEEATKFVYDMMVQEPSWMPGIPLDADVDHGYRYGEIK